MLEPAFQVTLERFSRFGDLLKFLRRRCGITQRELAARVGYSHAQISRLELNQRLPDLAMVAAQFVPALEIENEPAAAERLLELAAAIEVEEMQVEGPPPYKGLASFEEADASLFYGRAALTGRLVERLYAGLSTTPALRFLAVVGASGSGKSSILHAGLLPAIRKNLSFDGWRISCLTPTDRPLQSLSASLTREKPSLLARATLMDDLAGDARALHLYAEELLSDTRTHPNAAKGLPVQLLLVIDQFEELFTLCRAESERKTFVDNLLTAATQEGGKTFVVLALRADFYASCAAYDALRAALATQQEYIGPMSAEELRQSIQKPAQRAGWELEPGLVDLVLQEVGLDGQLVPEPGALPLLSHAMLETFHRRRGRTLTISGYLASGGVGAAIAETANMVYHDQLDADQQSLARHIFLRLTQLGEDEANLDTRRRVIMQELIHSPEQAAAVQKVLTLLADARLVTTNNEVVEVAHEALIREWPTLRGWLEEDRAGLRLHRHLTLASAGWEKQGRDPGELYRGLRLAQAQDWAGAHVEELSWSEQAFLRASIEQASLEEAERELQRQRELQAARELAETQRQASVQLKRRAYYLFGALILALALAGTALYFGELARRSAVLAQNERRLAYTRELAAAALSNLEIDPERSILLALQAVATTQDFEGTLLPEAQEALHRALLASQVRMTLHGHNSNVYTVDFSPDGQHLASLESDGSVIVWDAASGAQLMRFPGTTEVGDEFSMQRLAYSPDGKRIASGDGSQVRIRDAGTGELVNTLSGHEGIVWSLAYSPDGKRIASGSADQTVRIWEADSGTQLGLLEGHTYAIGGLAFSPDGKWLASASDDGTLKMWDSASGRLLHDLSDFPDIVDSVDFSPDGTLLAAPSGDGLHIWSVSEEMKDDLSTPLLEQKLLISGAGGAVKFSPDGDLLATTSGSTARLWEASTGREILNLPGHTDWAVDVDFSPDGKRLVTAGFDETVKVWNIAPGQETLSVAGPGRSFAFLAFNPAGSEFATPGADGSTAVWDSETGQLLHRLQGQAQQLTAVAYSPDGSKLATAGFDAQVVVWDAVSGEQLVRLIGHQVGIRDVAFSPDGERLATASFDQTARIWEVASGEELLKLAGHEGLVLGVAFSPDGQTLATSGTDQRVNLWDATSGGLLRTLEGNINPKDIAFSPDGGLLASGAADGAAILWDTTTGLPVRTLTAPGSDTQSLAFSPDGRWLAIGSGDNTAKVWDVETGQDTYLLPGSLGGVVGVAFNPRHQGDRLAVASADGIVRELLLNIDELVALAERRLTRGLTLEECQRYLHLEQCPLPVGE